MGKHLADVQWFLLWSVAFYATALGYVFEARGAVGPAVVAAGTAVLTLALCFRTAIRRRLGT
jgi:hypothetical protein